MSKKFYSLRLWPNGEFGVGLVTRFTPPPLPERDRPKIAHPYSWTKSELLSIMDAIAVYGSLSAALGVLCPGVYESTLEEITSLGSSNATKNHTTAKRGSKGVSSYGRRMIRNGAFLLEKAVGRRRVALLTTTIPPLPDELYKEVTHQWSEIVRLFSQWLVRRLKAAHGYPWLIGCVEVQEKRLENEGGLPLHLHLVFQSKTKGEYTINLHEVSRAWQRAMCCAVPEIGDVDFSSATRIEVVKKSVVAYISKYISKGVNQNVLVSVQKGFKIPSSWWIGGGGIKQEIKRRTMYETGSTATSVWWLSHNRPELFTYIYKVEIGSEERSTVVGICGKMCEALQGICRRREEKSLQILLDS